MPNLNIKEAKSDWKVCGKCGGSGFDGPEEGLYVVPVRGQPFYYQFYKKGKVVAQVSIVAIPCVMKDVKSGKQIKHITVEIHQMWTLEKHRKQGIMSDMLEKLKAGFQGDVRFVYTNWQDSTTAGRAFLINREFTRNGDILIWDRDDPSN